jgi:hypothetical protein
MMIGRLAFKVDGFGGTTYLIFSGLPDLKKGKNKLSLKKMEKNGFFSRALNGI